MLLIQILLYQSTKLCKQHFLSSHDPVVFWRAPFSAAAGWSSQNNHQDIVSLFSKQHMLSSTHNEVIQVGTHHRTRPFGRYEKSTNGHQVKFKVMSPPKRILMRKLHVLGFFSSSFSLPFLTLAKHLYPPPLNKKNGANALQSPAALTFEEFSAFPNFPHTLGGKFDKLETETSITKDLTCEANEPTFHDRDPYWFIGLTWLGNRFPYSRFNYTPSWLIGILVMA